MAYYVIVVFLSAYLIFQVQPMIAKFILPWFGGSSAVWSTVQMFFQVFLTGGYAYASWLTTSGKKREWVHLLLLAASIIVMIILGHTWRSPILPGEAWKPHQSYSPVWSIIAILTISVGLPYFLISSNSPLMQAWFFRQFPNRTAYKLYALSNVGSFIGLISYPMFIEPLLPLDKQGWMWSLLYVVFAGLVGWGAITSLFRKAKNHNEDINAIDKMTIRIDDWKIVGLWVVLAMTSSLLLLATTSQITQEVAVIPFLWVLPLMIYLLSFVLVFSGEKWYSRQIYLPFFFLCTVLIGWVLGKSEQIDLNLQLVCYSLGLFAACMVCHGELYRLRPHPSLLAKYYLMISVGGALGGIFITFTAPVIFRGYWELPLGICLCWIVFFFAFLRDQSTKRNKNTIFTQVIFLSALVFSFIRVYQFIHSDTEGSLLVERNFYGVIRVKMMGGDDRDKQYYALVHGVTIHGIQYRDPEKRDMPTAYFGETGGGGLAILNHSKYGNGMKVGILGLGIGTLASYAEPGDLYRFYEINPQVIEIALGQGGYFWYLKDCKGDFEIVPGDARLSLEEELHDKGSMAYDVLILDVFSSDSIPVHLLNREAFALYLDHLAEGGMLALHISNRHLDLVPVVLSLADYYNLARVLISDPGDGGMKFQSLWMLLALDPQLMMVPEIAGLAQDVDSLVSPLQLWTDDYSNLFQILK